MSQGTNKETNKGTSKESDKELIYSVEDSIATITLNRPERMNALTPALEAELHRAFDEADADRAVRVIILTGAGRAFCAGYDQGQTGKSGTRHSDPKGKSHRGVHRVLAAQRRRPGRAVDAYVAARQADHRRGQRLGHGRRLLVPARRRHHHRIGPGGVRAARGAPHLEHEHFCWPRCAAGRPRTAGA